MCETISNDSVCVPEAAADETAGKYFVQDVGNPVGNGLWGIFAQLCSTAVAPALSTITEDLSLSLSTQTWTITSYPLTFGTALFAGGRLGYLIGEVRIIILGYRVF